MAKLADIKVGQIWTCRVSGGVTNVRVDSIRTEHKDYQKNKRTRVDLTNIRTGRQVVRSSAALRKLVTDINQ
jgi:hypothetical protein